MTRLITDTLGNSAWLRDLNLLSELKGFINETDFKTKWRRSKLTNKERLADWLQTKMGIRVSTSALFDIQIKRIHEYKRQLLNILSVIWRYRQIKGMSDDERADAVPRVVIFAGKAAPGYHIAKLIIKLINCVSKKINDDPDIEDLLKVVFIPNYNVSLAEILIPASDISQHISTAGTEASGTSNMKFVMNGGLLLGTLDGANVEISEEIGRQNVFIFGTLAHEVENQKQRLREGKHQWDPRLLEVIQLLRDGVFGVFPEVHQLLDSFVHHHDQYLLSVDWPSYLEAQALVDRTYKNTEKWTQMSILSTAGMGKFSSDRSIEEYAENIWNLRPCPRPGPIPVDTSAMGQEVPAVRNFSAGISPLDIMSPLTGEIALERLSPRDAMKIRSFSPSSSPFF
uniref:Alpha-1,4 glucan phosphorylase n=1 Tax=Arcella intermedia TaxID=1963864 RepID=A0A6B2L5P6_9EUKA